MKKAIIYAAMLPMAFGLMSSGTASAQAFAEGRQIISAGYGAPNLAKTVLSVGESYPGYTTSGLGPMHFKYEYGLSDKIGFGLSINYTSAGAKYDQTFSGTRYTTSLDYYRVAFNVRMNIHFATTEKLDPYWGIGAGYAMGKTKYTSNYVSYVSLADSDAVPFGFETTLGLRFFFTPNIGFYFEIGAAQSLFQGGLAIGF